MVKVLVIEDDPMNMKLATLVLRNAGHMVLCAANAEQGMLMANADQPDVILMDWELPGLSGTEANVLLKRNPATASIPVIACTASSMTSNKASRRGLPSSTMGFDAYIQKPFRYRELNTAINAVLTKPGPLAEKRCASFSNRGSPIAKVAVRNRPIVDVAILERLIGNDPSVIHRFLSEFQLSAMKTGQSIEIACAAGQSVIACREAHKLKSTAHMAGATLLGELCSEIESAGKIDDRNALARLLPPFMQSLHAVNTFLQTFLLEEPALS
jgi:two-component system, cell cycle response regulator DivK